MKTKKRNCTWRQHLVTIDNTPIFIQHMEDADKIIRLRGFLDENLEVLKWALGSDQRDLTIFTPNISGYGEHLNGAVISHAPFHVIAGDVATFNISIKGTSRFRTMGTNNIDTGEMQKQKLVTWDRCSLDFNASQPPVQKFSVDITNAIVPFHEIARTRSDDPLKYLVVRKSVRADMTVYTDGLWLPLNNPDVATFTFGKLKFKTPVVIQPPTMNYPQDIKDVVTATFSLLEAPPEPTILFEESSC